MTERFTLKFKYNITSVHDLWQGSLKTRQWDLHNNKNKYVKEIKLQDHRIILCYSIVVLAPKNN